MVLNDIQHMIEVFANLAIASAMGLCLVIGVAGTLQQHVQYKCGSCTPVLVARTAPAYTPARQYTALAPTLTPGEMILATARAQAR